MDDLQEIITKAARSVLENEFSRATVEPTIGHDGRDALQVTIVLTTDVDGDHALDTLVEILRKLAAVGDDRFPIIDYVTEIELQNESVDNGSPQPESSFRTS